MSKQITLTPATRKANRAEFVAANPWTPGKTVAEIKAAVESGEQTLKGRFVFAEGPVKTKAATTRKGATATAKANTKTKRSKKASKAKQERFLTWLHATAEERADSKRFRRTAATWARENGIVPNGQAWVAIKTGERDVATLKALNVADGQQPVKGEVKTAKPAKKETTVLVAAVEATSSARPRRTNGTFMTKAEADVYTTLTDNGLDEKIAQQAVTGLVGLIK